MAGVNDNAYRATKQAEIAERQARGNDIRKASDDAKAKKVYDESVDDYEREKKYNSDGLNKRILKGMDNVGDAVRSVGKFFGTNRMTSQDDTAQMQARKDVQGYKKGGKVKKMASGGKVSSASKRADGIAKKGKTRGKMV